MSSETERLPFRTGSIGGIQKLHKTRNPELLAESAMQFWVLLFVKTGNGCGKLEAVNIRPSLLYPANND